MLIYSRNENGVRYEVRTAGASKRLYTNGAFHSQHNPNHLFTGAVWDLLSLPSLFMKTPPEHVLVLGVGGGTVIHQMDQLHRLKRVVGVELDPVHIAIAQDIFGVVYEHTRLVAADAYHWLTQSRSKFDYIVDDIFRHAEDDPERPHDIDRKWFNLLYDHLAPGGTIVQNHIGRQHARQAIAHVRENHRIIRFETTQYENCMLGIFDTTQGSRQLIRQGESRISELPIKESRRLRASYRIAPR